MNKRNYIHCFYELRKNYDKKGINPLAAGLQT